MKLVWTEGVSDQAYLIAQFDGIEQLQLIFILHSVDKFRGGMNVFKSCPLFLVEGLSKFGFLQ
jgi:hypothetical protein